MSEEDRYPKFSDEWFAAHARSQRRKYVGVGVFLVCWVVVAALVWAWDWGGRHTCPNSPAYKERVAKEQAQKH